MPALIVWVVAMAIWLLVPRAKQPYRPEEQCAHTEQDCEWCAMAEHCRECEKV